MTDARAVLCDYILSSYAINRHLAGLPARRPPPGAPRRTKKSIALRARRLLRLLGEHARGARKAFTLFRGTTAATPWLVADRFFDPTSKQLRRGASALFTSAFPVREIISVTTSRKVAAGFATYFGPAGRRRRGWVHVIRCDRRVRSLSISPAACGAAWDEFAGEREVLLCPPLSATRTRVDRSRRTIYWRLAPADPEKTPQVVRMSSYKQRKNKQKLLSVAAGYSPSALASGKTLILLRGSRHRPTPGAYRSSGHSAPTNLAPKACPFVVRLLSALELEIVEDGELVPAELRAAEHGNTEFAALVVAERQARVRWSSIRSAWISAGVLRF